MNRHKIEWSARLCRVLREIAEDGVRERQILATCREILSRNIQPPSDVKIGLESDCLIVEWQGREVARQWVEQGKNRRRFEDGAWAVAIEKIAESFEFALPIAA